MNYHGERGKQRYFGAASQAKVYLMEKMTLLIGVGRL